MALPRNSASALRGQAATDFGRDLLPKVGAWPPLPEDERLAATVQVRLTAAAKRELTDLAARLSLEPSAVLRAITIWLKHL
jgi:hypothetical protein